MIGMYQTKFSSLPGGTAVGWGVIEGVTEGVTEGVIEGVTVTVAPIVAEGATVGVRVGWVGGVLVMAGGVLVGFTGTGPANAVAASHITKMIGINIINRFISWPTPRPGRGLKRNQRKQHGPCTLHTSKKEPGNWLPH